MTDQKNKKEKKENQNKSRISHLKLFIVKVVS